ncbi:MAG: tetratricopeptide repeat protein [Chitinispirillaceae bacterium]
MKIVPKRCFWIFQRLEFSLKVIDLHKIVFPSVIALLILFQLSCTHNGREIEKGEASLRLGDFAMAKRFFEGVLERDPEHYQARLGMGKSLIQEASSRGGDSLLWSRALTHLEAARSLRPEAHVEPLLSDAWLVQARFILDREDTLNALKALSRAIDLNPKAVEALNLAGIIYFRLGEPQKASTLFEHAMVTDTLNPVTYFNLGMINWAANDFRDAHKFWFKALSLAPEDKDILYWYAVVQKKLEEKE